MVAGAAGRGAGRIAVLKPRASLIPLSTAFLVLLETLNPAERAVFLLREVFEYDYDRD
jgi:DNA-directed RNA polymerase specialized sigma24 family protein